MNLPKDLIQELHRLYKYGNSAEVLAEWSGLSYWTVLKILKENS